MLRHSLLILFVAASLAGLAACDTADASPNGTPTVDPSAIDYDAVTQLDYETEVRPLLVARNVLSPTATTAPGDAADYTLDAVMAAGPSGFVVPFDAAGSLMLRFVADLPDSVAIPFPNLRRLEPDERRFLGRWIEAGARETPGGAVPFSDAQHLLFVCVQGENYVDILDEHTMRTIRRVRFDDLGFPSAPYGPHHVAFEPGGGAWYVTLISGTPTTGGAILKLSTDLSMDPSSAAYVLGSARTTTPGMIALDPSSDQMYVGRSTLSASTTTGFVVVDRRTMALTEVATPFNVPHAMAVTHDGKYVLTASLTGGKVAVYNPATEDLAITPVPGGPHELIHFAVLHHAMPGMAGMTGEADRAAHHGSMDHVAAPGAMDDVYHATLTSKSTNTILFYDLSAAGELTLTATAPAGNGPYHAHAGHDGRLVLIPDQRGDTVTIIDATSPTHDVVRTVSASAPGGPLSQPHSPAPGHDGTRFFVTSSNLDGKWAPTYDFLGPPDSAGVREAAPRGPLRQRRCVRDGRDGPRDGPTRHVPLRHGAVHGRRRRPREHVTRSLEVDVLRGRRSSTPARVADSRHSSNSKLQTAIPRCAST